MPKRLSYKLLELPRISVGDLIENENEATTRDQGQDEQKTHLLQSCINENRPIVVTSAANDWFTNEKTWSIPFLQKVLGSDAMNNVFASSTKRFTYFKLNSTSTNSPPTKNSPDSSSLHLPSSRNENCPDNHHLQRLSMPFNDFVNTSHVNDSFYYYLYGEPVPSSIKSLLPPPEFLTRLAAKDRAPSCNTDQPDELFASALLWCALQGNVSPLHYDLSEGFLFQLYGEKHFTLFPPSAYDHFDFYEVGHPHDRQSRKVLPSYFPSNRQTDNEINVFRWEEGENTNDEPLIGYECILRANEMIYIPYGWFHEVESEGESVSYTLRDQRYTKELQANSLLLHKYSSVPPPVQANLLEMSIDLPDVVKYYFMRRASCSKFFQTFPRLPYISANGKLI